MKEILESELNDKGQPCKGYAANIVRATLQKPANNTWGGSILDVQSGAKFDISGAFSEADFAPSEDREIFLGLISFQGVPFVSGRPSYSYNL